MKRLIHYFIQVGPFFSNRIGFAINFKDILIFAIHFHSALKNDCDCMFTLRGTVNYPVCNVLHSAQYVTTKRRRRRVGFLVGRAMTWYAY